MVQAELDGCRPTQRDWIWTLVAACAALVICGGYFLIRQPVPEPLYEQELIAAHLAQGHGFRSPMDPSPEAPATSYSAPLYPWLVSLVYRAAGVHSDASRTILIAFNALCFAAIAAGAYMIGQLLFGRAAGGWAAALMSVNLIYLQQARFVWDRLPAIALFAWLIVAAIVIARSGPTWRRLFALGIGLGVLSLINPSLTLAYPVLVLVAAGMDSLRSLWDRRKPVMVLSAVALLGFVLIILPWTIRNYAVFDRLMYIRGNYSLELWHGNLPESSGIQTPVTVPRHTFQDPQERRLMLEMGEVAYYDDLWERFKHLYTNDPEAFWWRTGNRMLYLLIGDTTTGGLMGRFAGVRWRHHFVDLLIFNSLFAVVGYAGVWVVARLRRKALWLPLAGLLTGMPFLPTHVSNFYTMPFRFTLAICGGFMLAVMVQLLQERLFGRMHRRDEAVLPSLQDRKAWGTLGKPIFGSRSS